MSYEEDFYVSKRNSELRTERNVLLGIGFVLGVGATLISIPLWMWVTGLI